MKLVHSELELQIDFKENEIPTLIIENPLKMEELVGELYAQIQSKEGRFVASEQEKILDFSKSFDIILNPFSIEVNSKKVIGKLYASIERLSKEEINYIKGQEIQADILKYLEDLCMQTDYPIQLDYSAELSLLYKAFNIRICEDPMNFAEGLLNYICIMNDLCGISCFILVNIKDYLSQQDCEALMTTLQYKKIFILLIESSKKYKLLEEMDFVIDKDLCEIY